MTLQELLSAGRLSDAIAARSSSLRSQPGDLDARWELAVLLCFAGELDRAECGHCRPSEHTVWADNLWQVRAGWDRMGLPYVGGIAPREHHRLEDAPIELLTTLGPLLQRVSTAVKSPGWRGATSPGGATAPSTSTCGRWPGRRE